MRKGLGSENATTIKCVLYNAISKYNPNKWVQFSTSKSIFLFLLNI